VQQTECHRFELMSSLVLSQPRHVPMHPHLLSPYCTYTKRDLGTHAHTYIYLYTPCHLLFRTHTFSYTRKHSQTPTLPHTLLTCTCTQSLQLHVARLETALSGGCAGLGPGAQQGGMGNVAALSAANVTLQVWNAVITNCHQGKQATIGVLCIDVCA